MCGTEARLVLGMGRDGMVSPGLCPWSKGGGIEVVGTVCETGSGLMINCGDTVDVGVRLETGV